LLAGFGPKSRWRGSLAPQGIKATTHERERQGRSRQQGPGGAALQGDQSSKRELLSRGPGRLEGGTGRNTASLTLASGALFVLGWAAAPEGR